ncbi:MAG: hypothetical protein WD226_00465, partial [Planctomycetota bacterium]
PPPRDGAPLIAWRLPPGASAAEELRRRGALRPPHALAVARHVVYALEQAHRSGLVHGALDLENVWLLDRVPWTDSNPHGVGVELVEFGLGAWHGNGKSPRPADDVRAAARLFYGLLVGSRPGADASPVQDLAGLPDRWGRTIERALADGYADAGAFLAQLARLDAPARDAVRGRAAAGLMFATTSGVLLWNAFAGVSADADRADAAALGTEAREPASRDAAALDVSASAEVLRLETRLAQIRDRLFQTERARAEETSVREALAARLAELDPEVTELRARGAQLAGLESRVEALTSERDRLASSLSSEREDRARERRAAAELVDSLRAELAVATTEREDLTERLAASTAAARREQQALAARLAPLTAELNAVAGERDELNERLLEVENGLARERAEHAAEARALRARSAELERERDAFRVAGITKDQRAAQLDQELERARATARDAQRATATARAETARLTDELGRATASLDARDERQAAALRERERRHAAEIARSRATIQLLEARAHALRDDLGAAEARSAELARKLADVEAERDALLERLERSSGTRRTVFLDAPTPRYARLVAEVLPIPAQQPEQPDQPNATPEVERLRRALTATARENAALLRALAEREGASSPAPSTTDVERWLNDERAVSERLRIELAELRDVLAARSDLTRQLDVARGEAATERASAASSARRVAALEARLAEFEERWLRREADRLVEQRAARLAELDARSRKATLTDEVRSISRRAAQLEEELGAARNAAADAERRLAALNETSSAKLAEADRRIERLRRDRRALERDLEDERETPRDNRRLRRRLAALEAERASLAAELADQRNVLRRRIETEVQARLRAEESALAAELAHERAARLALITTLDESRDRLHDAQRRFEESAATLENELEARRRAAEEARAAAAGAERNLAEALARIEALEAELGAEREDAFGAPPEADAAGDSAP